MRPVKIVAIVIGALLIIIGLALVVPGSFLLWIDGSKDESGFLSSSARTLSSRGYALATPQVRLDIGAGEWMPGDPAVQIRAASTGSAPVFVGIGPTDRVATYLSGVAHDEVTDFGWFWSRLESQYYGGTAVPSSPGRQDFWVAMQEGEGTQTLRWDVRDGTWTAVVMNADASAPVEARVSLGIRVGFLLPLGIGVTVFGVIFLAVGVVLVVLGARRPREPEQPAQAAGEPVGLDQHPAYVQPQALSSPPARQPAPPASPAPGEVPPSPTGPPPGS